MRLAPLLAAATWIIAAPLFAQAGDPRALAAEQRTAMARLSMMDGAWRGTAVTQSPAGPHSVTQTERIGPFIGGTIKVLEGRGFNADDSIGFNAFGIVSYDIATKSYHLHSYAQAREGSFPLTPTPTGYVWEIPAGPATIRYTATITATTWNEVGDRIIPGAPPVRFFEMNLKRIGDSRWPEEGALTPR